MKTLLVLGSKGQLGQAVCQYFSGIQDVMVFPYASNVLDWNLLDLTMRQLKKTHGEHYVINCAAKSDVDWCEQHPKDAWLINAGFLNILGELSNELGYITIHISTNFVYSYSDTKFCKWGPVNIYGKTKAKGEENIRQFYNVNIIRTSWLYSWYGKFFSNLVKFSRSAGTMHTAGDIFSCPTSVWSICKYIDRIIQTNMNNITVNCVDTGSATQFQYIKHILGCMDECHLSTGASNRLLVENSEKVYHGKAPRPKICILPVSNIGVSLPIWEAQVKLEVDKLALFWNTRDLKFDGVK